MVLARGSVTVAVMEPAACTSVGLVVPDGVVTMAGALAAETLPAPSRASTV